MRAVLRLSGLGAFLLHLGTNHVKNNHGGARRQRNQSRR